MVVFFKEGVIFFKYWCYLGHFELGWECFFGLHLVGHFGKVTGQLVPKSTRTHFWSARTLVNSYLSQLVP